MRISINFRTKGSNYNFGVGSARNLNDSDEKPKILVLGAGYGGAAVARAIEKSLGNKVDLTVVDKRHCSVHKMASLRAATLGPTYSDRVLIPNHDLVLPEQGQIIYDDITSVSDEFVELSESKTLTVNPNYDFIVCATGAKNLSIGEPPLNLTQKSEMAEFYKDISEKIKHARRICLIGGGSVGVELAGEIKFEYPDKMVSIVHAGPSLINRCQPPVKSSFQRKLLDRLKEIGVYVFLGQRIDFPAEKFKGKPYRVLSGEEEHFTTDKGHEMQADLVLLCTGKTLSNGMYPKSWIDTGTGLIRVRRTLQVVGSQSQRVYAIGDINDFPENKQGYFAGEQGRLVASNIKRQLRGKKLKNYVAGFGTNRTFMFISLGRRKGLSHLGYLTVGSLLTTQIKCKDMFTKENWQVFRQGKNVPAEIGGPSKGGKVTFAFNFNDGNVDQIEIAKKDSEEELHLLDVGDKNYEEDERQTLDPKVFNKNNKANSKNFVQSSDEEEEDGGKVETVKEMEIPEETVENEKNWVAEEENDNPNKKYVSRLNLDSQNLPEITRSEDPKAVTKVVTRSTMPSFNFMRLSNLGGRFSRNDVISFVGSRNSEAVSMNISDLKNSELMSSSRSTPMIDFDPNLPEVEGQKTKKKRRKNRRKKHKKPAPPPRIPREEGTPEGAKLTMDQI